MDLTLCDLLGRRTAGSPGLRYHRGVQEAGVSSVTKPGSAAGVTYVERVGWVQPHRLRCFIISRPTVSLEKDSNADRGRFAAESHVCSLAQTGKSAFETADTTPRTILHTDHESHYVLRLNTRSLTKIKEGRPLTNHGLGWRQTSARSLRINEIQRLVIGRQLISEMLGLTAPE